MENLDLGTNDEEDEDDIASPVHDSGTRVLVVDLTLL